MTSSMWGSSRSSTARLLWTCQPCHRFVTAGDPRARTRGQVSPGARCSSGPHSVEGCLASFVNLRGHRLVSSHVPAVPARGRAASRGGERCNVRANVHAASQGARRTPCC
jgi:hypothetical protein